MRYREMVKKEPEEGSNGDCKESLREPPSSRQVWAQRPSSRMTETREGKRARRAARERRRRRWQSTHERRAAKKRRGEQEARTPSSSSERGAGRGRGPREAVRERAAWGRGRRRRGEGPGCRKERRYSNSPSTVPSSWCSHTPSSSVSILSATLLSTPNSLPHSPSTALPVSPTFSS